MAPCLERDDHGERDDDEREQEVRHHGERVEVEDDRDAAERDLGDGPEEGRERGPLTHRGSPATRRDACQVARDATIPQTAITRFPNSTIAWKSFAGNGVEPHRGQLSQPSPEPVSRTKAPDATTRPSRPTVPNAMLEEAPGRDRLAKPRANAHPSDTPLPCSTLPTVNTSSAAAANVASSTTRLSAGSVTSRPPAVCGS